jgi:hypothetical protein
MGCITLKQLNREFQYLGGTSMVTGTGNSVDWQLILCSVGFFQAFYNHVLFIKKLSNIPGYS